MIPGDSAQQRQWTDTGRTREAPSTAAGSRGPTRSLRSALEVVCRPSLFDDGRRLNVEWHSLMSKKLPPEPVAVIPRFLARTPLGHTLPVQARAIGRQDEPRGSHVHYLGHRALATRS